MGKIAKEVKKMDKKILAIIGLIGGILTAIGVFGTWMTEKASTGGTEVSISASGWDLARGTTATSGFSLKLPYLALVGGILAVVGSVIALVKPIMVTKVLLAIGGILALMGVAFGLVMADTGAAITGAAIGVSMGTGYGTYLVVIGGILAILVTLGLKEE
jgi:hypothetical protein